MLTLKEVLHLVEDQLNAKSKDIYTKLGIKQTTYSAWHTGRTKSTYIDFYECFKAEFGVDLYASQHTGEIVVISPEKFLVSHK